MNDDLLNYIRKAATVHWVSPPLLNAGLNETYCARTFNDNMLVSQVYIGSNILASVELDLSEAQSFDQLKPRFFIQDNEFVDAESFQAASKALGLVNSELLYLLEFIERALMDHAKDP